MTAETDTTPEVTPAKAPRPSIVWIAIGVVIVLGLAWLTRYLDRNVPVWLKETSLNRITKTVEYPVYAIAIGLLGNALLTLTGLRDRVSAAFRTEFFIKTGLVIFGASINFVLLGKAAGPAIVQALLLISSIFLFTWYLGGLFGLDAKLRALLSAAVSICGVSAAIAAAGAVRARREQLAYTAGLVIAFALPSIFLLPWLADVFGLSPAVAGAWIGGNIDTTAAVTAAGALAGPEALTIATIVKTTQNALIGIVAIALTAYFALRVEHQPAAAPATGDEPGAQESAAAPEKAGAARPGLAEVWRRFPKFVLGFVAASALGTWYLNSGAPAAEVKAFTTVTTELRTWFLVLAFVSIGLEFRAAVLRREGWRPVFVFGTAAVANLALGLGLALLLFSDFAV